VLGINTNVVDSSNKTALDIVRAQKTRKAQEITKLIAGSVSFLLSVVI